LAFTPSFAARSQYSSNKNLARRNQARQSNQISLYEAMAGPM